MAVASSLLSGVWSGFEGAIVSALNVVIAALASVAQGGFDLLPSMPALPTAPEGVATYGGWVAWVFPVGTVEDIIAWATTMWLLWFAVSVLLRWAKVERGSG